MPQAINIEWAIAQLREVLSLMDSDGDLWNRAQHAVRKNTTTEIQSRLIVVRRIANATYPELTDQLVMHPRGWGWNEARNAVTMLIGALERQEEADENLGPQGPRLAASSLHPWVWDAAARLWDDGHRREAAQAAATAVNVQLQIKLGRNDISDADLVTQAFTIDPSSRSSLHLRFVGLELGSDAYKSVHEGAMHFGRGCFMAIRNPTTHSLAQPDEATGLEMLAALSLLARWIDEAEAVPGA